MDAPLRNTAGDAVWDQRSIANAFLLEHFALTGRYPTAPWLSRALFILETTSLMRTGSPAMYGWFEAWQRGPVQPVVAMEFREFGLSPIGRLGMVRVPFEAPRLAGRCDDEQILSTVHAVTSAHATSPQWLLDGICCAPKGAWSATVEEAKHRCVLGMRVTHALMRERAKSMMCHVQKPRGWRKVPDRQFGCSA